METPMNCFNKESDFFPLKNTDNVFFALGAKAQIKVSLGNAQEDNPFWHFYQTEGKWDRRGSRAMAMFIQGWIDESNNPVGAKEVAKWIMDFWPDCNDDPEEVAIAMLGVF